MYVYQRIVSDLFTILIDLLIDGRALVCCCRIAIYRPRRKKGRIKCDAEKRHSVVGAQKIDEKAGDVLRFDFYGDKNTSSIPSVANCLLSSHNPPPPHSAFMQAKRLKLTTADTPQLSSTVVVPEGRNESRTLIPSLGKLDAAAASQSERRTHRHDALVTILNVSSGTTGRLGSWIQRSLTHTQRESPNAKFHCQWHERVVVFCFGLLPCMMFSRLIISTMTFISPNNETRFIETFSLTYRPFRFSFLPCPKQANQRYRVGQSQQSHESWSKPIIARRDAQTISVTNVVTNSFLPRLLPVRAISFSLPKMERPSVGSIPPTTIAFSVSLFPSSKHSLSRF